MVSARATAAAHLARGYRLRLFRGADYLRCDRHQDLAVQRRDPRLDQAAWGPLARAGAAPGAARTPRPGRPRSWRPASRPRSSSSSRTGRGTYRPSRAGAAAFRNGASGAASLRADFAALDVPAAAAAVLETGSAPRAGKDSRRRTGRREAVTEIDRHDDAKEG